MSLDSLDEKKCLKEYLYYYLKGIDLSNSISGSAQPQITIQGLKKINVKLYDLDTQKNIVNKFKQIEILINLRKSEIEKCYNLIKSQFVKMFGDLKEYPLMTYKECTDFVDYRGHTPEVSSSGFIRMINAKSVGKGFFKYIDEYVTEETYNSWMHRGFGYPGDVLFVTEGHTFGNTCLIPDDLTKFALGQRVITIKGKNMLNNIYLNYYMQTKLFIDRINVYKTGGTAQGIRSKDLLKVEVPVPLIEQQNKFAKFVKQVDKQKFIIVLNSLKYTENMLK